MRVGSNAHPGSASAGRERQAFVRDAVGAGLDQLVPADVDAVLQAYPRLGFKEAAIQGIIDQCERKPFAYTLHPWAEVARRHIEDFPAPTVEDLIQAAPFAD
jgi:hypothetical protein